jgi:hypothetical protein
MRLLPSSTDTSQAATAACYTIKLHCSGSRMNFDAIPVIKPLARSA